MFRKVRDAWLTVGAVGKMSSDFFRRWFLPLHSDDDDEEEEESRFLGWNWDDEDDDEDSPRKLTHEKTPSTFEDEATDRDDL